MQLCPGDHMRTDGESRNPVVFYRSAPADGGSARLPAPRSVPHRKKAFTRRRDDISQQIRLAIQLSFALITIRVGLQFYFWVRYYETAGRSMRVDRPDGVEAWLPIAALMNLKAFVMTGTVPDAHAAGMFMLIAFLTISLVARKAFCSWICPIGTLSEWLWQVGESTLGRTFMLPRWLDIALRSLKYILLVLFLYVVVSMTVSEIRAFLAGPYGQIADVKMLDFFRRMGQTTAIVLAVLVTLSLVVKNVWCRYLCPYGALMGLAALVSPTMIVRDPRTCIDCAKCAKACPAGLPVDQLIAVRSAECSACMSCVAVCPAVGALDLKSGIGRRSVVVTPWALAAAVILIFLGIVGLAQLTGHWHTTLADNVYFDLIPRASELSHPH